MIESRENTVNAKEEPNDTWPNTDDGYFDLVDSCEVKNVETFTFHKSSVNAVNEAMLFQKKVDEKIFVNFECKYVKPELTTLSRTMCKTEYQNFLPTVKIENQIEKNFSNEKRLVILIKKGFNYNNNCQFQRQFILKLDNSKDDHIFEKGTRKKISHELNLCRKNFIKEASLKTHVEKTYKSIRPFDCQICYKSFGKNYNLKRHVNAVHDRIKPFECDICHKSFGLKNNLRTHISAVHDRSKPYKCDICQKSFGEKLKFRNHINTVHNEICHFANLPHMPTHPALIYNAK
ncbi:myoneurin-like [Trichogramma pretiosum]|uniref:myoneurin-like n=1 Tax=Trichogramma pretiosum TaxID=7493 RepID=UPI000C71B08D|nr:myoneurin-like [Trichogramma pretiosum]